MKFIPLAAVALAVLTACTPPTPEERMARTAANAQLNQEITRGMTAPATVAVGQCIGQVEGSGFSEATLLNAGFRKGNVLFTSAYVVDVTGPVKQGLAMRPLSLGVNIGPASAVNFGSGCKISLPNEGDAVLPFALAAQRASEAKGYAFTIRGGGSYFMEKGDVKILMTITRTIGNGGSFIDAQIRRTKS